MINPGRIAGAFLTPGRSAAWMKFLSAPDSLRPETRDSPTAHWHGNTAAAFAAAAALEHGGGGGERGVQAETVGCCDED
jgi:hypothetical protein